MKPDLKPLRSLRRVLPGASFLLLTLSACGGPPAAEQEAAAAGDHADRADRAATSRAFLANLASQCGEAFPGGLTLEPPGDDMLRGDELLLVHFRECSASGDTVRIPFHIESEPGEWNRSRTWILTLTEDGGLELRHDHREPDGTPSEVTFYGGFSDEPGTANRQDFTSVARTESSGFHRGWRIEIEPGIRYTYGTTRRGEWSWRIDFDLTTPVAPPPAPWGHE